MTVVDPLSDLMDQNVYRNTEGYGTATMEFCFEELEFDGIGFCCSRVSIALP